MTVQVVPSVVYSSFTGLLSSPIVEVADQLTISCSPAAAVVVPKLAPAVLLATVKLVTSGADEITKLISSISTPAVPTAGDMTEIFPATSLAQAQTLRIPSSEGNRAVKLVVAL